MRLGNELRALDDKYMVITGAQAFMYSEWPTPTTGRYVFAEGVVPTTQALGRMQSLLSAAERGEPLPHPYAYFCRVGCRDGHESHAARDAHELAAHSRYERTAAGL